MTRLILKFEILTTGCHVYKFSGTDGQWIIALMIASKAQRGSNFIYQDQEMEYCTGVALWTAILWQTESRNLQSETQSAADHKDVPTSFEPFHR
jgi:hypothetical protein